MNKKVFSLFLCGIMLMIGIPFVSVITENARAQDDQFMPTNPYPAEGSTAVIVCVDLCWTCNDTRIGDPLKYDVYFGTSTSMPKVAGNQTSTLYNPGILGFEITYYWQIYVWYTNESCTEGPIWQFTTGINQPPYPPVPITGPVAGGVGISLDFSTLAPDPEGDELFYFWDWGDGSTSGWLGPYSFGEDIHTIHQWEKTGEYNVRVKARDKNRTESEWSDYHTVSIARQIHIDNLKPGFVYFRVLMFDKGYLYVPRLEDVGFSMVISTGGIFINASVSDVVHSVKFEVINRVWPDQAWMIIDEEASDGFNALLDIPRGFHKINVYAYDADANMIDIFTRHYIVFIEIFK